MDETNSHNRWFSLPVLILAFAGAAISVFGAILVYSSEAQISSETLWPLPGLILSEWALMGIAGFVIAYISLRKPGTNWPQAAWFVDGMFIPMIVLGAWSIGAMVLLVFLLYSGATIALSIYNKTNWLESFGLLLMGAVINLGILYFWITIGPYG